MSRICRSNSFGETEKKAPESETEWYMRTESAPRRAGTNDRMRTVIPFSKERRAIVMTYTTRQVLMRGVKASVRVLRIPVHVPAGARERLRPSLALLQCPAPRIARFLDQPKVPPAEHRVTHH